MLLLHVYRKTNSSSSNSRSWRLQRQGHGFDSQRTKHGNEHLFAYWLPNVFVGLVVINIFLTNFSNSNSL